MKVLLFCALIAFASCQLLPTEIIELVDLHNKERSAVGVAPLIWDPILQLSAQIWATRLAIVEVTEHSGTPYVGENIAAGTTRDDMTAFLFSLWSGEKAWYIPGCTWPNCSSNGNEVGHYTQVIWQYSVSVGCGKAINAAGWTYLVCQYFPYGNVQGNKAA